MCSFLLCVFWGNYLICVFVKGHSWDFTPRSTARVILEKVLSIFHLWESNPHRGDSLSLDDKPTNPLGH